MGTLRAHKGQTGRLSALVVGCIAGCLAVLSSLIFPALELNTLDMRFALRGTQEASEEILIVEIDDEGLDTISHWSAYARVIARLKQLGARLVIPDIIFRLAGEDAPQLVDAIRTGGRVVVPAAFSFLQPADWFAEGGAMTFDSMPLSESVSSRAYPAELSGEAGPLWVDRVIAPYEPVLEAAEGCGHIGAVKDPDRVLRRISLVVSLDGRMFPHLTLEATRLILGAGKNEVDWTGDGVAIEADGGERVFFPTDANGQVLLDYTGSWYDAVFWHLRADEILETTSQAGRRDLAKAVKDKICLLGVTGTGLTDVMATPFDRSAPGVLGLATLMDQLISRRFLTEIPTWFGWLFGLLVAIAVALQAARPSASSLFLASLAGLIAIPVVSCVLFCEQGAVLPTATPLVALLLALVGGIALRWFTAEKARREVVAAFGRYLSPAVLDKVLERGQGLLDRSERKTLTILFSDVVRFSSFCDEVEAEEVRALLNEYLEEMVDCLFSRDGTVDKFMGDGLLAFFGDPLPQDNHAERAVRAGLDMLQRVTRLNASWQSRSGHSLQVRIGINTGSVVVGNVGATRRTGTSVSRPTSFAVQRPRPQMKNEAGICMRYSPKMTKHVGKNDPENS